MSHQLRSIAEGNIHPWRHNIHPWPAALWEVDQSKESGGHEDKTEQTQTQAATTSLPIILILSSDQTSSPVWVGFHHRQTWLIIKRIKVSLLPGLKFSLQFLSDHQRLCYRYTKVDQSSSALLCCAVAASRAAVSERMTGPRAAAAFTDQ